MNGKTQQIQVPCAPLMVKGLKADYHTRQFTLKQMQRPFDAGFDIYPDRSGIDVTKEIGGSLLTVHTSLIITPAPGTFAMLTERSSSWTKLAGARVRTGVIDAGYTGELLVQVTCPSLLVEEIKVAIISLAMTENAIAQIILLPCLVPMFAKFDEASAKMMRRGSNGFGSTDKK